MFPLSLLESEFLLYMLSTFLTGDWFLLYFYLFWLHLDFSVQFLQLGSIVFLQLCPRKNFETNSVFLFPQNPDRDTYLPPYKDSLSSL